MTGQLPHRQTTKREPVSPVSPEDTEQTRRRRRPKLTDLMVENLRKKAKRYTFPDPELGGHYIRVMPDGPNVFVAVARNPYGKQVWHKIGSADALTIEKARKKAIEAIERIKEGKPAVEAPPTPPDAFKIIAENWLKRHVQKEKLRSQAEIERCLAKYVYPHWADRAFTSIKRSDIAALLDFVEDNNGPRQADVCLGILRSIANWYATRHDTYLSPFIRGMGRDNAEARSRILDDDELRRVWKQAEASGTFGTLIKMLLLTGQRRGAVLRMRWDDISADGVWEVESEQREKGNIGAVKLPALALEIIHKQPKFNGNPFVFAASRGDKPANGFSRAKRAFDKRCGVEKNWTLHDLRRCARSLMSRAGVQNDVAERVLGHVQPGVQGIYNRHDFFEEKADALRRLAALIDQIVNPTDGEKVVPMRRRAAKS